MPYRTKFPTPKRFIGVFFHKRFRILQRVAQKLLVHFFIVFIRLFRIIDKPLIFPVRLNIRRIIGRAVIIQRLRLQNAPLVRKLKRRVNMERVKKVSSDGFEMENKEIIPISRNQYSAIRDTYLDYRLRDK